MAGKLDEKTLLPVSMVLVIGAALLGIVRAAAAVDIRVDDNSKTIEVIKKHDEQRDESIGEMRRRLERIDVQIGFLYDEARKREKK